MKVFVTGATGFVGSHVVDRLVSGGHQPMCLVRETSDTSHLEALGVATHVGSLTDIAAMAGPVAEADALIHMAGVVKVRDFDDFYRLNGQATGELADLASRVNPDLDRFVYVSSLSARGPSDGPHPLPDSAAPAPVSHYGRSKLLGEHRLADHGDSLTVTTFRPPPVYGPRDREMFAAFRLANFGVAPVYGDGSGYLSVVHVHDLADAVVRAIEVDHPAGSVFTIDDGDIHTWNSLTARFGRALGTSPRHIHVPRVLFHTAGYLSETFGKLFGRATIFNTDKVAEMSQTSWVCDHRGLADCLDWTPEVPLAAGAAQTARWYRQHGWL